MKKSKSSSSSLQSIFATPPHSKCLLMSNDYISSFSPHCSSSKAKIENKSSHCHVPNSSDSWGFVFTAKFKLSLFLNFFKISQKHFKILGKNCTGKATDETLVLSVHCKHFYLYFAGRMPVTKVE